MGPNGRSVRPLMPQLVGNDPSSPLLDAERLAPQAVRHGPVARDLIQACLRRSRCTGARPGLDGLAQTHRSAHLTCPASTPAPETSSTSSSAPHHQPPRPPSSSRPSRTRAGTSASSQPTWPSTGSTPNKSKRSPATKSAIQFRKPDEPSFEPLGNAVLVAPATFNTINKWALGINDSLALGLLNEALGRAVPIEARPCLNDALAIHPAYRQALKLLADAGVVFEA